MLDINPVNGFKDIPIFLFDCDVISGPIKAVVNAPKTYIKKLIFWKPLGLSNQFCLKKMSFFFLFVKYCIFSVATWKIGHVLWISWIIWFLNCRFKSSPAISIKCIIRGHFMDFSRIFPSPMDFPHGTIRKIKSHDLYPFCHTWPSPQSTYIHFRP